MPQQLTYEPAASRADAATETRLPVEWAAVCIVAASVLLWGALLAPFVVF